MVSLDEMIKGAWIDGEMLEKPGDKFIQQLADLLVQLHSLPHGPDFATYDNIPESPMRDVVRDLVDWKEKDAFTEDALYDYYAIRGKLDKRFYLHGDLWRQNILVDKEGNLNGLRDWETFSYGDPHWDFRMIRRWIGWDGLGKLIFLYNCQVDWNVNHTYIEILDRISICHSIRIRKERGLLRHDKPDAIENFEDMKRAWINRPEGY
jgi:aminoglycoside phosphotransferase (APT) family kinase protein|tara:strand:+ start:276 stop:896 length:621 start_codon:yes stop_codon:yes gene_type:complete